MMSFLVGVAAGATPAGGDGPIPLTSVSDALLKAAPGDEIVIADGDWADVELKWHSPGFPVTVRAAHPGKVKISGKSQLRISGDSLSVSGLDFRHVAVPKGGVIEFRSGKEVANACRLTDCIIDSCNPSSRSVAGNYIVMHGRGNRVDHCSLTGKLNLGVTLLVNLNDARSLDNRHRIDHNYFGPRPVYGSNGAETMRIGTSQQSYESSRTIVENNLFDRCNGEVEIISVKSSDNVVRDNMFHECQGVVALRHGRRNRVTGNQFRGNSVPNTGGVRIVDAGHEVSGNTFDGLAGTRFFSALALMNSVPNSLPNRYVKVSDVNVHHNTFSNCTNIEFGTGRDMERTEAPSACSFNDNIIISTTVSNPYISIDPAAQVAMAGNRVNLSSDYSGAGFTTDRKLKAALVADPKAFRLTCGAARPAELSVSVTTHADTILLTPGVTCRNEPWLITRPTVMLGNGEAVLRWTGSKPGNFITICDGGSLKVEGVTFDFALQQGYATVRNAIATAPVMITSYTLDVENCRFINSPESGCCAIRGGKGTFAESISVNSSLFSDLSGNGIWLADETDDKGVYSADHIFIKDCSFSRMLGLPVSIYRGGSDESTAGPYVTISDCLFTDCCNKERGSVLRLIGPQKLYVTGCHFERSGRGGATIRLDETTWEDVRIKGCRWTDSGRVISNRNVIE